MTSLFSLLFLQDGLKSLSSTLSPPPLCPPSSPPYKGCWISSPWSLIQPWGSPRPSSSSHYSHQSSAKGEAHHDHGAPQCSEPSGESARNSKASFTERMERPHGWKTGPMGPKPAWNWEFHLVENHCHLGLPSGSSQCYPVWGDGRQKKLQNLFFLHSL